MRGYGRFIKNIAGVFLFLGLVSLLLPFCKFETEGQEVSLSGVDVIMAGARVGSVYMKTSEVSDDLLLKAPVTWGDVREALGYVDSAGMTNQLIVCGAFAFLPVLLCFLAMLMTFMAEGKKTMFFPTLFTLFVVLEMVVVIGGIPELQPFLLAGVYLFSLCNLIALVMILFGWITGGYRRPDKEQKEKAQEKKGDEKNKRRFGRKNRKKRRNHRKKSRSSRGKKEKKEGPEKKKKEDDGEQKIEKKVTDDKVIGRVHGNSGIYKDMVWNLKGDGQNVKNITTTIGTTPEAMKSLCNDSLKTMSAIADHNCVITYDCSQNCYIVHSHSIQDIFLYTEGKSSPICLTNGKSVQLQGKTILEVRGTENRICLE